MRTGVSYLGALQPRHLRTDLEEMRDLRLDDVFLAMQENDFIHYPGKLRYTAEIAHDLGIRPLAIFWGALNLFGGGRSSQFLLEHPEGHQVGRDGSYRSDRLLCQSCLRRQDQADDRHGRRSGIPGLLHG